MFDYFNRYLLYVLILLLSVIANLGYSEYMIITLIKILLIVFFLYLWVGDVYRKIKIQKSVWGKK